MKNVWLFFPEVMIRPMVEDNIYDHKHDKHIFNGDTFKLY